VAVVVDPFYALYNTVLCCQGISILSQPFAAIFEKILRAAVEAASLVLVSGHLKWLLTISDRLDLVRADFNVLRQRS